MKINQFKIIVYTLTLLLLASSFNLTYATSGANVYSFPATATKYVNDNINVAVKVDPAGNDVCVVKGTIVFENLSCKNITLTEGLMAQTIPTCSKPNFTVGIPSCTKTEKTLFTVNTDFASTGSAGVKLSGVSVIGVGVAVPSSYSDGNYTVLAKEIPVEPIVNTNENTETINIAGTTSNTSVKITASSSETKVVATSTKFNLLASVNDVLSNVSPTVVYWLLIIIVGYIIIVSIWLSGYRKGKKAIENKDNK
ncbi:MAG: hypothetical protein WCC74_01770 [Minisyncoccia bacterium]